MHGARMSYYIHGEGVFDEPSFLSAAAQGCPVGHAARPACSPFMFGRMFAKSERSPADADWEDALNGLVRLGLCMNDPAQHCQATPPPPPEDSPIPAGYTYLGQFIAHEVTFDNANDLPAVELNPETLRSPTIDLDSLYGPEPRDEKSRLLYVDGSPARLKVGTTLGNGLKPLDNDLPRDETGRALAGDKRNDENLVIAQTTVALIKFHNKVVETLEAAGHAPGDLFERAREQVIRHFQWIVLHDYLPAIADGEVLRSVLGGDIRGFKVESKKGLFMPLEFSAAAFRLGHSMVRLSYEWNLYHSTDPEMGGKLKVALSQLFDQTAFSGVIGKPLNDPALASEWVADWRRFYEFPAELGYTRPSSGVNKARRLDTHFDFRLDQMANFPHLEGPDERKSITVRNLLRGLALGLPTGEEAARGMGETPLTPEEVAGGPHEKLLSAPVFKGKTPLWYYILKEAETKQGGGRLGRVGSRIVVETLYALIKHSRYSILDAPGWYPTYTRRGVPGTESARFEMTDLLDFAGVVNPIEGQ